jgi:predicted ester cyclase
LAFAALHFQIEKQIAEGDRVVNRLTARGTHKGEFWGIPATGKEVTGAISFALPAVKLLSAGQYSTRWA